MPTRPAQRALWQGDEHRQRRSPAALRTPNACPRCWPRAPPTRTGPTAWPATWNATIRPGAPGKRWRAPHCPCSNPATCSTSPRATACWPNCSRRMRIRTSASTPASAWSPPPPNACACYANVEVREGDMHALAFKDASFDLVLLMHALTYAEKPAQAVPSRARAAPGGRLLAVQPGQPRTPRRDRALRSRQSRLHARRSCARLAREGRAANPELRRVTREKRPPHFEVVSLLAKKI
jgi:hypothetical protein